MTRIALVLALLLAAPAFAAEAPPWQGALDALAARRDAHTAGIERTLGELRARCKAERPDLLPRLSPPPPKPWPTGYGILPRIDPDPAGPPPDGTPLERRYALAELGEWTSREERLAGTIHTDLARRARPLDALVDEYLLRAENARRIDEHVKYHALWQREAWLHPGFGGANDLLTSYRLWRSSATDDAARGAAARGRRKLEEAMLAFKPVPWHRLRRAADGSEALVLPLQTDVSSAPFLATVGAGIERVWNEAPAMKAARLRLRIEWVKVEAKTLYPKGAPARGAAIDAADHLRRFPPGYALTTGASSVHVLASRGIILGGAPVTCHTIAHEVAHLLGFSDRYLRAYEGSPNDPQGAVFYEVTPFPGDLMSDSGAGVVSEAMVRDLQRYREK
ncbi:MAG: hypothetical protein HY078_13265 [Elusimicrobia bacterium]|nr:hypothetical protein [Elusimicrobiota bacterium]